MSLLDTLSATAIAAYSTRLLRTAYAGAAIRVVRSNDLAQQDIGFSGGDLDTTSLASFVGANSAGVVTWYDQSGNANNATAGAPNPQVRTSGTNITLNGHVSIRYSNALGTSAFIFGVARAQPDTLAFVSILSASISGAHWCDGQGGSPRQLVGNATGAYQLYAGGSPVPGGTIDTNAHGFIAVFNAASSVLYIDNVSTVTGNPGTDGLSASGGAGERIGQSGGGSAISGDIPEFMVFTSAISSGDRTTLTTDWGSYWLGAGPPPGGTAFRRTLSALGTRVGTRQVHG